MDVSTTSSPSPGSALGSAPAPAGIRGQAGAAIAMTLVGTLAAVSATINRYPLFGGQAIRYAIASVLFVAVGRATGRMGRGTGARPRPRDLLRLAALAATGLVTFNVCVVTATEHAGPAVIGTVLAAAPVALALAGPLQRRQRPSPVIVAAAVVVTTGAAVVIGTGGGHGGGDTSGLLLSLGALAGELAFSLLAVPLLPRLGPVRVSAYAAALAVPMLLVCGLAADGLRLVRWPSPDETLALVYLGGLVTTVPFLLWYDALGRIGAERAGLFAGVIPLSTVATAAVLGMGAPSPGELAGAALVGAGVVIGAGRRGTIATVRDPAVRAGEARLYSGSASAALTPGMPDA